MATNFLAYLYCSTGFLHRHSVIEWADRRGLSASNHLQNNRG